MGEEQQQYFAVYVPPETDLNSSASGCFPNESFSLGVICNTLHEADSLVKKYETKGARFKKFTDFNQAKSYIMCGQSVTPKVNARKGPKCQPGSPFPTDREVNKRANTEEKPFPFPSISRSDVSSFRRAVEEKNDSFFDEKVAENPRYLINCNSDSPTILHEGCRYNAMHYATKVNNLHVCKLIIDLFSDVEYVRTLFPDDSLSTLENRREFLLDRYLNTPDKALNETPLHFAAKSGFVDLVKLLISIPGCQKDPKNKYGETPADLAHTRCADALLKSPQLKLCLEEEIAYVPLYRKDNSYDPILKQPCVGFPSIVLSNGNAGVTSPSHVAEVPRLVAFAGPMSVETAKKFYAQWSSHKPETKTYNLRSLSSRIKRTDVHKGMEQLGRRLAQDVNVDWSEYWEFLKTLCDIRGEDGLRLFEKYFANKLSNKRKLSADDLFIKVKAISSSDKNGLNSCRTKLDFSEEVIQQSDDECEIFYDTIDYSSAINNETDLCQEINGMNVVNEEKTLTDATNDDDANSDDNFAFQTPPETPPTVFIYGDWPTKTDLDVFLALENVTVNQSKFPNVYRWLSRIAKYSNEEQNLWPALDSPRIKRTLKRRSKDL